jgi:hypothetical protein
MTDLMRRSLKCGMCFGNRCKRHYKDIPWNYRALN